MPPTRGKYTRSTPSRLLSPDELESLVTGFAEHRKSISCPNCHKVTTYHNKGEAAAIHHHQPHYRCKICAHTIHAPEMLDIVTSPRGGSMPQDFAPPDSQTTETDISHPTSTTSPQLDVHTLLQMITKLTTQVEQQQQVISNLTEEIHNLKQMPQSASDRTSPPPALDEFPALNPSSHFSTAPWHQPQRMLHLKQNLSKTQEKRETAAARFFQAPSLTQGFQYLYIPTKARVPLGKLRTTFKKLGVNNGRLLDLHYPDRNIVAALVHNDYATELQELLTKRGIKLQTNFDPCHESVLKDPKYNNEPPEKRQQIARELHNHRLQKALVHIRGPAKHAVARFFAHENWITNEQLAEILENEPHKYHSQNPTHETIFEIEDSTSDFPPSLIDDDMEEDAAMHSDNINPIK